MALTSFRSVILASTAVAMTISTSDALSSYLTKIPNGSLFSQALGHPDNDSSQYTEFATAFADAGHEWTSDLCNAFFPGSEVKNGEAFGDPCCTWTEGGTPDYTVTAFTDAPTSAGTCSTTASGSAATSAAASTAASTAASASAETTATSTATSTTDDYSEGSASSTTEESSAYDTETEAPSAATSTESSAATTTSASNDTEGEGSDVDTASSTAEETEAPAAETPTSGGCRAKTPDSYSLRH